MSAQAVEEQANKKKKQSEKESQKETAEEKEEEVDEDGKSELVVNLRVSTNRPPIHVSFGKLVKNMSSRRIRPALPNDIADLAAFKKSGAAKTTSSNNNQKRSSPTSSASLSLLGYLFSPSDPLSPSASSTSSSSASEKSKLEGNQQNGGSTSNNKNNNNNSKNSSSANSTNSLSSTKSPWEVQPHIDRLRNALQQETVNTVSEGAPLRKELWLGATEQPMLRAEAWRMTLGISPATMSRRIRDAQRQLHEYRDYLELYYYQEKKQNQQLQQNQQQQQSSANSSSSSAFSFPDTVTMTVPPIEKRTKTERDILNQLAIDLPRHKAALYRHPDLLERLRRCLFVWSLRNPAVGYVQGMDDVVVVLFLAFLDEAFAMIDTFNERSKKEQQQQQNSSTATTTTSPSTSDIKRWLSLRVEMKCSGVPNARFCRPWTENDQELALAVSALPRCALDVVECDTYNCGGRFLSWGMDRYTFGQPGVLSCVDTISAGVKTFDPELYSHIRDVCGLEFRSFAYKYVHLLLVRDLGQWLSMRLFDTLLSTGSSGCWELFSYFCCAFLISIKQELVFDTVPDEALMLLQEPSRLGFAREGRGAARWMDELLSQAYMLMLKKKTSAVLSAPSNSNSSSTPSSASPSRGSSTAIASATTAAASPPGSTR